MPELPDLQAFSKNLHKLFAGKKLQQVKVVNAKKLKDSEHDLHASLQGNMLTEIYRTGKELRFRFADNLILGMHLMLNGDLYLFDTKNEHKNTIVELHFDNGKGIALTDWQTLANVKLNPEEKDGIDALSEELDVEYLKKALQSKAKIKSRITDQNVIRGIGNAYADEILWEARISPFSISKLIPDEKIKALTKAIKSVLLNAEKEILKKHPDIISGEVRDFLNIHNSRKEKSPTGAIIKVEKKGGSTYYTDEQELYV